MIRVAYEVTVEGGVNVMRSIAPIRGITVPCEATASSAHLTTGYYVATITSKGAPSLDDATFSKRISKKQATDLAGGDPWEENA